MKILITGATGFLGSHLCHQLVRKGHQVTAFIRPNSDLSRLEGLDIKYAIGDLTDVKSLKHYLVEQDSVIHTAAVIAYWQQLRYLQTQVNVEGTRNLIVACKQQKVKRLVHVSSVAAIGIPSNQYLTADENFAFNLENSGLNYHLSKWQAEAEVLQQDSPDLEVIIVNPSSIFGPFGKTYRGGETIEKVRRSRIVPYFLGGINVVHIDDVVDGICKALEKGKNGDRYILGGENMTYYQINKLAATSMNLSRIFVPVPPVVTGLAAIIQEPIGILTSKRPRFTYDIHYCAHRFHFYSSKKAQSELGYTFRNFQTIVEDYLNFRQAKLVNA